jgi:Uma2 family endonuclease
MSIQSHVTTPAETRVPIVPPLESGDRLTRDEFERRYTAMPRLKNAELIDGVVFVGSPVSDPHSTAHSQIINWLATYAAHTPGVRCGDNASVRLDMANVLQPDALLRIASGGQSKVDEDKYVNGGPELIAEVALTSASRDLHSKLSVYCRHGVREYIVWRVLDGDLDWFRLVGSEYERQSPDAQGIFRCQVFPGLWLDKPALLRGDMAAVLALLSQGLASPEHAEFALAVSKTAST